MKEIIHTSDAPEAIGPYSQAVTHAGVVEFAGDDVESQAKQVMKNLKAVLEEAGSSFDNVIKCSIFLADMSDFGTVNEIYGSYFGDNPPARETVAVKTLPKSCKVEISCIAHT